MLITTTITVWLVPPLWSRYVHSHQQFRLSHQDAAAGGSLAAHTITVLSTDDVSSIALVGWYAMPSTARECPRKVAVTSACE